MSFVFICCYIKVDLDVCKVMLLRQQGVLHPFNVWHVKTLDLAFESAINMGKWEDALEFGNELLPGFRLFISNTNSAYFCIRLIFLS